MALLCLVLIACWFAYTVCCRSRKGACLGKVVTLMRLCSFKVPFRHIQRSCVILSMSSAESSFVVACVCFFGGIAKAVAVVVAALLWRRETHRIGRVRSDLDVEIVGRATPSHILFHIRLGVPCAKSSLCIVSFVLIVYWLHGSFAVTLKRLLV